MAIHAQPEATFEASLEGAPTGLTGTLGVQVINPPAGTVMTARTTAGIVEQPAGSGIYHTVLTAPAELDTYSVVWDTGGATPEYASEDLVVSGILPTDAAYATEADFEAYVEGWEDDPTVTSPALGRYLVRASRDIDRILGAWPYLATGLKFDKTETDITADGYLTVSQSVAITYATCAQALYRIQLDEARSSTSSSTTVSLPLGAKRVRGPDFEVEYATGTTSVGSTLDATYPFSSQALAELEGHGLFRRTTNGSVSTAGFLDDGVTVFP